MNPVGELDIYFSNAACGDNCRQIVALCAFLVMSKCRKVDRSCHRDHRHNCTSIDLKSYHICCMQDHGWIVWKKTIVILSWYLHITHTVDICYRKRILSRDDMGSFLLSNSLSTRNYVEELFKSGAAAVTWKGRSRNWNCLNAMEIIFRYSWDILSLSK